MERKTIVALALLAVAVVAISVGILVTYVEAKSTDQVEGPFMNMWRRIMWRNAIVRGVAKDIGPRVEVSDEFKELVVKIVSSDADTSKLLAEGYNITNIRPVIKAYVGADGTVNLKAVEAIVTLNKSGTGRALAIVNIEQGKVVKIYMYTVIEK